MSVFYSLKSIARATGLMSKQDLKKLIHAFVSSRLVTVSFQASAVTKTKKYYINSYVSKLATKRSDYCLIILKLGYMSTNQLIG